MAYDPTVWASGDVVTATKLNKIEQGIADGGGGGHMYNIAEDDSTGLLSCNATPASIKEDFSNGIMPSFIWADSNAFDTVYNYRFNAFENNGSEYYLELDGGGNNYAFLAGSLTDTFEQLDDGGEENT